MKIYKYKFLFILVISSQVIFAQKTNKPNIIFILADDLGWSDVGGRSDFYETPRIDKFLDQGLTFNYAYSNGANCAPTRAAYLSGRYAAKTGIVAVSSTTRGLGKNRAVIPPNSAGSLPENVYSIAKAMKDAGYYTGIVGKWHVGYYGNSYPSNQGYDTNFIAYKPTNKGYKNGHVKYGPGSNDYKSMSTLPYYEEEDGHVGNILAREALHFLENAAKQEKPFFLDYHQFLPHGPLQAPEKFITPYKNKPAKKGLEYDNRPDYAGQIACLDYNVGRILDKVNELGIADNTIIVFASDNGGVGDATNAGFSNMGVNTSNLPLKGRKNHVYEGGIRTPFSIYWPGITKPNTSTDQQLMLFDLYPTFVDIAQGKLDENGNIIKPDNSVYEIDGKSLKSVITGKSKQLTDRDLFWIYPAYVGVPNKMASTAPYFLSVPHGAIRTGDFKLVYNWEYNKAELFNIKEDFEELHNIAAKHPEMVALMTEKLVLHAGKFAPVRKIDTQWPFVGTELSNNMGSTNIYVQDINDEIRKVLDFKNGTGVYITHISKENFVKKSKSINVAYNYLLTKIDGIEIKNTQHAKELLKDKKMGAEIPATFWKMGKEKPCIIKLDKTHKIE
ncbi:sulfatase [Algibacter mikhailovii]|uniref:Sulfatase n=1 Tax=Algibacter mikhailovii TaxID=425498 RepID=A0A918RCY1_9FLAO|nr:sulfatase [Algibacter mikhailovii]GGZ92139.1 sulfatase [Algibacter mikhailovii]